MTGCVLVDGRLAQVKMVGEPCTVRILGSLHVLEKTAVSLPTELKETGITVKREAVLI